MPKFFRNLRIQSIKLSKIKNYLLYAVGEIILVVAGILIAVYIGEERESLKNEAEVEKAITQVAKDLEHDVSEFEQIKKYYEEKDSLIVLLLQNKLNKTDIRNNLNVRYLVTTYFSMNITTIGYNALTENLPSGSLKNDSLLFLLNKIYFNLKKSVEDSESSLKEHVVLNIRYMEDNFPFFASRQRFDTVLTEQETNFYLHDWHYKNQLARFQSLSIGNLVKFGNQFEFEALSALALIKKNTSA